MRIIKTRRFERPFTLLPGDTFNLLHVDDEGVTTCVLSSPITQTMKVDIAHVIEFEDGDLGLEYGIGGVFGKEEKEK